MKDALGHGSDGHGVHSTGIDKISKFGSNWQVTKKLAKRAKQQGAVNKLRYEAAKRLLKYPIGQGRGYPTTRLDTF